jgi:hypothetical protein
MSGEQSPPDRPQANPVHPDAIEQGGKVHDRNELAKEVQNKPEAQKD